MKIERIELRIVSLPFVRRFTISSSSTDVANHIIIRVFSEGLEGFGECASTNGPFYCHETVETCWCVLRDFLCPPVLNLPWDEVEDLEACWANVKGNRFAIAGLEMACWDLLTRSRNLPLSAALGGTRREILSGVSIGIQEDLESLFDLIEVFVGDGYKRIKLKIAPGKDIHVLEKVRKRYPDLPLTVDANSAYTLDDASVLRELDKFGLLMIEQPLADDDLLDHAKLQADLETPICLDESIRSVRDARAALELGSCRIINIKVTRLGGLLNAKRVHDFCLHNDIPVWCGAMHEFGMGRAANVALASLPGFSLPGDVCGFEKDYSEDIVSPYIRATDGTIQVPNSPGLGFAPDIPSIRKHTVRELTVTR